MVGETWGVEEWIEVVGNGKKVDSEKWDWEPHIEFWLQILDLKNKRTVRDLVSNSHCEDAGTQ